MLTGNIKYTRPLLKWVGGKSQIMNTVISKFPNEIKNYREIFMGGGSVLLALLTLVDSEQIEVSERIYAYDINPYIINFYTCVRDCPDKLYDETRRIVNEYNSIVSDVDGDTNTVNVNPMTEEEAHTSKKSFYYWCRKQFNIIFKIEPKNSWINTEEQKIKCAALVVVLNKLCFRGMYREGPNGFNVPYGHCKKTPDILPRTHLDEVSGLLNKHNVVFEVSDFNKSILTATDGDFAYLDPPYAPEAGNSFVGYTADGFGYENHIELFDKIKNLDASGVSFAMSNAQVPLVTDQFPEDKYEYDAIVARRAINSKNPAAKTTEIVISNHCAKVDPIK